MQRIDLRAADQLRPFSAQTNFIPSAAGSVLVATGDTRVLCTCMVDESVPPFRKDSGAGWITAEYGMLPASTLTRKSRGERKGHLDGRTVEIQRLIGRSLRSVCDLTALGERTLYLDCDVIQADGGTRTAAITGSFIALALAVDKLMAQGLLPRSPIREQVAAVSVGIVGETPCLDLCYQEDSRAQVDMNVVMTASGALVEVQGTGEERPFSRGELDALLALAQGGIERLLAFEREALGDAARVIGGRA